MMSFARGTAHPTYAHRLTRWAGCDKIAITIALDGSHGFVFS